MQAPAAVGVEPSSVKQKFAPAGPEMVTVGRLPKIPPGGVRVGAASVGAIVYVTLATLLLVNPAEAHIALALIVVDAT